jgi:toxin ParE1/3/4
MHAKVHAAANAELIANAIYIEGQRRGSSDRFLQAFENAREYVIAHPLAGSPGQFGTRSVGISGFSHDVVYIIEGELLLIVAVAHHRRRPGYWSDRF